MGGSMLEGSKGIPIILKLLTTGSRIPTKLFNGQVRIGDGLTGTCLVGILARMSGDTQSKKYFLMGKNIKAVVFSQHRWYNNGCNMCGCMYI